MALFGGRQCRRLLHGGEHWERLSELLECRLNWQGCVEVPEWHLL